LQPDKVVRASQKQRLSRQAKNDQQNSVESAGGFAVNRADDRANTVTPLGEHLVKRKVLVIK